MKKLEKGLILISETLQVNASHESAVSICIGIATCVAILELRKQPRSEVSSVERFTLRQQFLCSFICVVACLNNCHYSNSINFVPSGNYTKCK
ncbi:hypothetical protein RchiOBHm_Chr4g0387081 [Rosa chinensis]|uniref:Uncharacterized protein n=1 Tax=Rosa chinensis TaxID=74649 RepID=A0A2P6QPD9_ROSCH|nr:hypothetical protein RchiOBHm_Chr4g0387081 [Rosa chinensis]